MTREHRLQEEIRQTGGFRSRSQEATVALLRTADVVRRRLSAVIEADGLTLQQYNVLRILRGARGRPMATLEIGERLIEQAPGITRLLDRLEGKGLVRRERNAEDRRLVHCWITDEGEALLDRLADRVDEADEASVRGLSAEDLERLLSLLEGIRARE